MSCAICSDPPFVFIHIPKTGGTSFISRKAKAGTKIPNLTIASGHTYLSTMMSRRDIKNHFKFTIVRNPYDRFISLWLTKYRDMSLQELIDRIRRVNFPWYALRPQYRWVSDCRKRLLVDHFIKYENYEDEINEVLEMLGLRKFEIPHLRKTERVKDYKVYYKQKSQVDFVTNLYSHDLRLFGYSY